MMTKLSDTARVLLSRAAKHAATLAEAPARLPAAARIAVIRSMLTNRLLEEVPCPREQLALAWREGDDGAPIALRITGAGLRAIGIEPAPPAGTAAQPSEPERDLPTAGQADSLAASEPGAPRECDGGPEPAVAAPVAAHAPTPRGGALRDAAVAVLAAWDAPERAGLDMTIGALRAAFAKPARTPRQGSGTAHSPRTGTKQEAVLALLRRTEGWVSPREGVRMGWTTSCPTIAEFAPEPYLISMLKAARLCLLILTMLSLALAGPVQANCNPPPAVMSTPCSDMTMGAGDPERPQPDAPEKACAIVQCPSALPQFAGMGNELELPVGHAIRRMIAPSPAPAGADPAPEQRPPIF